MDSLASEAYVLMLVGEGRMSMGCAAELLDVTGYDLHSLAEAQGMELGATEEQRRQSKAVAKRLVAEGR